MLSGLEKFPPHVGMAAVEFDPGFALGPRWIDDVAVAPDDAQEGVEFGIDGSYSFRAPNRDFNQKQFLVWLYSFSRRRGRFGGGIKLQIRETDTPARAVIHPALGVAILCGRIEWIHLRAGQAGDTTAT